MSKRLFYALNTTTPEAPVPTIHYELTNHLGNVMAVITDEPAATETPAVESLTDYYPFGMTMPGRSYNAHTFRHGFTGHEKESDLAEGIYTTEYRLYDARVGRWLSVDPLFEDYKGVSPYAYCLGNPVKLVDTDGEEPRLYVEVQGVGHVFVTTGSGGNLTVYTYGRYAELGKDKSSARSTSPIGEGVLIVLKGEEAKQFVSNQITEKKAAVFEFMDASDSKVDEFYMMRFNNSDKIPTKGKYKNNDNARIINEYNLMNNNCATTSVESILYGGGDVSSIFGDNVPFMVAKDLYEEVAKDQSPISRFLGKLLFGDYKQHIRLVPTEELLKEINNE